MQAHNGTHQRQNIRIYIGIYREFDEIAKMHINRSNSHLRVQLVKHALRSNVSVLFFDRFLPSERHFSKFWCSFA